MMSGSSGGHAEVADVCLADDLSNSARSPLT